MCVATFLLLLGGAGGKVVTHTPASLLDLLIYKFNGHAVRNDTALKTFVQ